MSATGLDPTAEDASPIRPYPSIHFMTTSIGSMGLGLGSIGIGEGDGGG